MNARQKAKKYKHMYEDLLKRPVIKFNVGQPKIDTLRFERYYPVELITQDKSVYLQEVILKDIAQGLASSLGKYIIHYAEYCPHINQYHFVGEIKVVDRLNRN